MEPPQQTTKNPVVRRFREVAAGEHAELMVAEGSRLVAEVLDAGCEVVEFAWSARLTRRSIGETLLDRLRATGAEVHDCNDRVLQQLSHLKTHQGVSVILRRPTWTDADLLGGDTTALVVAAAGLQDPGNLGAVVRAAQASGATGLLTVEGSADPFRDKAVRGSAGSIFRLPCRMGLSVDAVVAFARTHDLQIIVAEDAAATPCWDVDLRVPTLLVMGSEGKGIPDVFLAAAHQRVGVPLEPVVESLNVAVAAGVLLFEARRQRREVAP